MEMPFCWKRMDAVALHEHVPFIRPMRSASMMSQVRGASRVILIDNVADRLSFAQSRIPGLEIIDFNKARLCTELYMLLIAVQSLHVTDKHCACWIAHAHVCRG